MGPYRSDEALASLQKGAEKMEKKMSKAARVRRQFRLGRPPKGTLPLHPTVAWQKADSLFADFRNSMKAAGLSPDDVDAQIIGVLSKKPTAPVFISLLDRDEAVKTLSAPDILAIGMIFRQHDAKEKKNVDFFVQFTGLSEEGLDVLKKAVAVQQQTGKKLRAVN